jgi:hypothetical protein
MPSLFHVLLPELAGCLPHAWCGCVDRIILSAGVGSLSPMPDGLDVDAMIARFRERAKAVKDRPMPPVEGPERQRFRERQQVDFMDFAMVGDAEATIEDGVLVLRVDLRPKS